MFLNKLKERLLNKKVEKIEDKLNNDNETITSQYNMRTFRIIKGAVVEVKPDIFNGAFNCCSKRMYLKSMFSCNPQGFVSYLKELSHNVGAIQLEFDSHNNFCNVEVEIYLDSSNELKDKHLNLGENCSSISLNNAFYNEVIRGLSVLSNIMFTDEQTEVFELVTEAFSKTLDDKKVPGIYKNATLTLVKCIISLGLLNEDFIDSINNKTLEPSEFISFIKELPAEHISRIYFEQFNSLPDTVKSSIAFTIEDTFEMTQHLMSEMKNNIN